MAVKVILVYEAITYNGVHGLVASSLAVAG